MSGLLEPATLLMRIEIHIEEETRAKRLLRGSFGVLREAVIAGEVERSKIPSLTGYEERGARNVTAALVDHGAGKTCEGLTRARKIHERGKRTKKLSTIAASP